MARLIQRACKAMRCDVGTVDHPLRSAKNAVVQRIRRMSASSHLGVQRLAFSSAVELPPDSLASQGTLNSPPPRNLASGTTGVCPAARIATDTPQTRFRRWESIPWPLPGIALGTGARIALRPRVWSGARSRSAINSSKRTGRYVRRLRIPHAGRTAHCGSATAIAAAENSEIRHSGLVLLGDEVVRGQATLASDNGKITRPRWSLDTSVQFRQIGNARIIVSVEGIRKNCRLIAVFGNPDTQIFPNRAQCDQGVSQASLWEV